MFEISPAVGIVILQDFAERRECDALLQSARDRADWHAARVGEYEHNNLVVATIDPEATTAEVTLDFNVSANVILRSRAVAVETARCRFGLEIRGFSKASMSRYAPGASVGRHRDTTTLSTQRLITTILYLNDDFSGGELAFPDIGITYKPGCGDLVIFLSEFFHSVATVIGDYRYCLIQFGENRS